MDLSSNANTRWAASFVEELANCGLEAVCLAPGSRSTPLALAFAARPDIRLYRHLDERSAGFFALGLALATDKPVALVCTSGTAAANFHPAIIEAYYSYVPLLVLTADRPPELRGSGANQTIDQIKMFGDHVRWAVDLPTPQDDAPDVVLRHLRTLAARAYATASGLVRGPVHLNFPFRKPLEPSSTNQLAAAQPPPAPARPYTLFGRGHLLPDDTAIGLIIKAIEWHPRGLIICGPCCPGGAFPAALAALAETTGFPILADPLSNVRHGPQVSGGVVLGGYNLWLHAPAERLPRPEVILRFGAVPTSATLASYVAGLKPNFFLHVREDGQWADDQHQTDTYLQADPAAVCEALAAELARRGFRPQPDWAAPWLAAEARAWAALDERRSAAGFFDGAAVARVLAALPDNAAVFAGNSMPVRYIDAFDRPDARSIVLYGNRGASGIDGNVSTALGLAAAEGRPVVALLGDITFYHDMNGLLAVGQHALNNVAFVITNNDGGGIFRRLPIAHHDPPFTDLFLTPHGLTFDHAAAMYGLRYRRVTDVAGLDEALVEVFDTDTTGPYLIEVITDGAVDYEHHRTLLAAVAADLSSLAEKSVESA